MFGSVLADYKYQVPETRVAEESPKSLFRSNWVVDDLLETTTEVTNIENSYTKEPEDKKENIDKIANADQEDFLKLPEDTSLTSTPKPSTPTETQAVDSDEPAKDMPVSRLAKPIPLRGLEEPNTVADPSEVEQRRCSECRKLFRTVAGLKRHLETHVQEKSYSCGICGKQLKTFMSHQLHVRQHKKKWFKCKYCNKRFIGQSGLNIHLTSHNKGDYQFNCRICLHRFQSAQILMEHMRHLHSMGPHQSNGSQAFQ